MSLGYFTPGDLDSRFRYQTSHKKLIVNVGSVGQPRDKDPRACYVEVRGPELLWHRVEYDVDQTIAKIKANERIPDKLGDRLRLGI